MHARSGPGPALARRGLNILLLFLLRHTWISIAESQYARSGPGNGGLRNLGIEGLLRPEGWNIGIMELMMHLLESKVEVADHTKRFSLDERQFGCVLGL